LPSRQLVWQSGCCCSATGRPSASKKSTPSRVEARSRRDTKTMSTTLSASTLLAVPLAPLVGSALAGILGTTFGGNVIGRRASHTLTILGVLVAFILSAITLKDVIGGSRFNDTIYQWMVIGDLTLVIGFMVDGLSAMLQFIVIFVTFSTNFTIIRDNDD